MLGNCLNPNVPRLSHLHTRWAVSREVGGEVRQPQPAQARNCKPLHPASHSAQQVLTYHFLLHCLQGGCDGIGAAIRHVPAQTFLNVPVQLLKSRPFHREKRRRFPSGTHTQDGLATALSQPFRTDVQRFSNRQTPHGSPASL